ncbi:hypothetical protein BHE74_00018379 [Ensete ventricosum]|nr:hypothetical protein BHE74_00018379 [Ensete ventricosum]RZR85364.1 hypothetical protein BHM03_00012336 [Ensete ventricosum]
MNAVRCGTVRGGNVFVLVSVVFVSERGRARAIAGDRLLIGLLLPLCEESSSILLRIAASMATRYWIVSLPVPTSASSRWNRLRESISKNSFDTLLYRVMHRKASQFNTPDLRVGTLDSLLSLSDDLVKVIIRSRQGILRLDFAMALILLDSDAQSNAFIEGVTHKIRRQIEELEKASGVDVGALTVDGVPVDSYLTRLVFGASLMDPKCFFRLCPLFDDFEYPRGS